MQGFLSRFAWASLRAIPAGLALAVGWGVLCWGVLGCGMALAATVAVDVSGARPGAGRVFVSLCRGSFEAGDCGLAQVGEPSGPTSRFVFTDVAPGLYAVAVFQDVNRSGTLDRSAHGLPLEPYGFSGGTGRTGAPRFERAAVPVNGDTIIPVRIAPLTGRP